MKALMLHSENSAVGKYRIWTPAKYLARMGWDIQRIPDEPVAIPNDRGYSGDDQVLVESAKKYGSWEEMAEGSAIIVMQRPDQPVSIALAMALREQCDAPLVFEVDDNIYDVAESSTQYQYWYPGSPLRDVAELLMREADALTVSTPELINVYKHLNPNIYVLPNFQDLEDWKDVPVKASTDRVVIGWQGSSTHYDDMYMIRRPLKKLLRNHPNVVFRCLGMKPDFLMNHPQVEISTDWSPVQKWPAKLPHLGFDIGIAPVVDRPFNRAKSNIKWQEYSMIGIPTIASKVGEYKAIEHEKTGILADSEQSWYFWLERLVEDATLRNKIGQAAQRKVKEDFNIKDRIGMWDEAYRTIINQYSVGKSNSGQYNP